MICPACNARKLSPPVFSVGKTFTDLALINSGPDDGIPHQHDPNSTTEAFECMNGHRFKVESFVQCRQCDHGHREPLTIMLPSRAMFKPVRP